jgi:Icc-related predicted phosphoesterase
VDADGAGEHLGSEAVLEAVAAKGPALVLCGHVHDSWGQESTIGPTRVLNLGPSGTVVHLPG